MHINSTFVLLEKERHPNSHIIGLEKKYDEVSVCANSHPIIRLKLSVQLISLVTNVAQNI